ncbi:uncharacterized protein LOC110256715 [Sus scrofa]|nr:uncharacterized protein LOC110256715 [Sus scrofa]
MSCGFTPSSSGVVLSSLEYLSHPGVVRVGSVPSGCGPSSGTWSSVPSARACSGQWSQIPVSSSPVGSPTFSDIRAHRRPRWSLSTISFLFFLINVMWRRGQRSSVPDLPGKAALHYGGSKETVGSPPSAEDSGPWTPNADKDEGREEEPRRICPMDGDTALSVTQQTVKQHKVPIFLHKVSPCSAFQVCVESHFHPGERSP